MEDERQKKIQAGKERLAAFQKKKARKKNKKPAEEESNTSLSSSDTLECSSIDTIAISSVDTIAVSSLETLDQSSLNTLDLSSSESLSMSYDSDQLSITSSGEMSSEEFENSVIPMSMKRDFAYATERIAELEESLLGKQLALDSLVQENNTLKTQQVTHDRPLTDSPANGEAELSSPYSEVYLSETHQLMEQVQVLQMQLQKAGQVLNIQMSQHHFSAEALLEAKNQMLGLQDKILQKDNKIAELETHVSKDNCSPNTLNSDSLVQLTRQDNETLKSENEILKQHLKNFENLKDTNEKLVEQLNSMKNKETELQSVNEALRQNLDMIILESTETSTELENVKQQLNLSLHETATLKTVNESFKTESSVFSTEEITLLKEESEALKMQNESLRKKLDTYQVENSAKLEAEIESLKQKLSSFSEEEFSVLKLENESLKEKFYSLNLEEVDFLKSELHDLRMQLDSFQKRQIQLPKSENECIEQKSISCSGEEIDLDITGQKLEMMNSKALEILRTENDELKIRLESVNFEERDLLRSENAVLQQRLDDMCEQLDYVSSDEIVSSNSVPCVLTEILEVDSLPAPHDVQCRENSGQLISVSVIENDITDTEDSRTPNISEATLDRFGSETEVHESVKHETEVTETVTSDSEASQWIETSVTESEFVQESENGVNVKTPEVLETTELPQTDRMETRADDTQAVLLQNSADMKSVIITDIESRLCELEAVNSQLKSEKDQLLQDFEELSTHQKLEMTDAEALDILKMENDELKIKLESVNFEERDLLRSENAVLRQRLDDMCEQLDYVSSDGIVSSSTAPCVLTEILEVDSLPAPYVFRSPENSGQLISVSVIENDITDTKVSTTPNISEATFQKVNEIIKPETTEIDLSESETGEIVKSETEAAETVNSYSEAVTQSQLLQASGQGVNVKTPDVLETTELPITDRMETRADDTQTVLLQNSADMKSVIIADIESRLCELETVNSQLKSEKDQLLQDFEGLMASLELFKVAEDEKEKLREKLELELDRVSSEMDVLRTSTKDKDFEIESLNLQLEKVNVSLSSVNEEKILLSESIFSEQTMLKDQVTKLSSELDTSNSELLQIKSLVQEDTNEEEQLNLHEVIRVRLQNSSQEIAETFSEKELAENKFREAEIQLEDYATTNKAQEVSLQEQLKELNELQLQNEQMTHERISATEQIEGLRGQLMAAENELQELRYESETMQSLITDINKEKENQVDANPNDELDVSVVEHEKLQHKLREVLQENIVLKESLKEREDDIEKYEADNSVLQDSMSTAEQEIENLKTQQAESLEKMPDETAQSDDVEQKLESISKFLSEARSVIPELIQDDAELELTTALQHIHERLLFLNSRHLYVKEIEAMQENFSEELKQSKIDHQTASEELNMMRQSYFNLEKQLENNVVDLGPADKLIDLEEIKVENIKLYNQLAHYQNRAEELKSSKEEADTHVKSIQTELEEVQTELKTLKEKANSQIKSLETELEEVQSELKTSKEEANSQIYSLETELEEVQSELKSSKEEADTHTKSLQTELEEVQSELKSSKEEANSRIKSLETELEEVQSELMSSKEEANSQIKYLETELEEVQSELMSSKEEADSHIKSLITELEEVHTELKSSKEDANTHTKSLQTELEEVQTELKSTKEEANSQIKSLQTDLEEVQTELKSSKEEANSQIKSLETELEEVQSELKSSKEEADTHTKSLQTELKEVQSELKSSKEEANSQIKSLETELEEVQTQLKSSKEEANSQIKSLETELEEVQYELKSSKEEADTHTKSLQTELEEVKSELMSSKEEANSQIRSLETELEEVQTQLKSSKEETNSQIKSLETELEEVQSELKSSKEETDTHTKSLETVLEEVQSELKSSKEEANSQIKPLQTELEEVQTELKSSKEEANTHIKSLETELEGVQSALLEEKQKENSLKKQLDDLGDELHFLKNENQKLSSNSQSLMNELEFTRSQHAGVLENIQQECEKQSNDFVELEGKQTQAKEEASSKSEELVQHRLNLEKQLRSLEEEKERLNSDNQYLNQQLESVINKGKFFEDQILSFETQIGMLSTTAEALRQDKKELMEELESIQIENVQQEGAMEEISNLKEEIKELSKSLKDADSFIESMRDDKLQLCEELETLHASKGTTSSDISVTLRTEVSNLKQQLSDADSPIITLRDNNNQLKEEIHTLTEESSRYPTDAVHNVETVKEKMESLKHRLEDSNTCCETVRESNTVLSQEIRVLHEQKDRTKMDFDHSIEIFKGEINNLQEELEAVKKENYALVDRYKELENADSVGHNARQITDEYFDEYVQTENLESNQGDDEMRDLKAERDKFKEENTATEDQYQKLLTEYQSDVESLRCDLEEKILKEQYTRDELETAKRNVKTLSKENRKLQDHYQSLAVTAAKFGIIPEDDSSQTSTEVEDMESEEDNTDTEEEQLETLKLSESGYPETDMRVLMSEEKQASVEADDKLSLTESIQEEDAEIQAQYKAMLHDSEPQEGSSGITYTEEEYEEKLKSLAAKFEDEVKTKEDFILDQHEIDIQRIRIEWEYDFRVAKDKFEKEKNIEYTQKVEAYKFDKEREFVDELRKARLEIQRTCDEKLQQHMMPQHLVENSSEVTGEHEKLRLENQELGEARDALLQQLNDSIRRQKDLEDVLDLIGVSPSIIEDDATNNDTQSSRDSNVTMPLHFEPEIDFCLEPLFSESTSEWQPEHDSFELEDALRNSERLSEVENLKSPSVYSETGAVFCENNSNHSVDEDSLDFDLEKRFNTLQSEHDQLLVKANDLEETVLKLSPIKPKGGENMGDADMAERLLQLEIERETLEHKIKEQRELFSVEKSELQQKCHTLTLDLETFSLYKKDLEQELESMTEAFGKRGGTQIVTDVDCADVNQPFARVVETDMSSKSLLTVAENQNVLIQKVAELSQRCCQYESVITDLKKQIQTMRNSNVIFTEEVTQQEAMQSDLFEEVKRLDDENDNLRSFISQSNQQQTQTEPRDFPHHQNDEEDIRSMDSLETKQSVDKDISKNEPVELGILEEPGWEAAWDNAARQSLDSLDDEYAKSNVSEGEQSPDSLDDVSSLCDQMFVTASTPHDSQRQNVSTETLFVSLTNASTEMDSGCLWSDEEGGLTTKERFYQLEMEKMLLKAKVSKLEEDLAKLQSVASDPKCNSERVTNWVRDNDDKYTNAHQWRSSSESLDNAACHRLVRESSSMVESSSTVTSPSGGSVENLIDARFREKTAVRYPVMGTHRETSSSPSPARESSSFPSVFEEGSASETDKGFDEDLFSPRTVPSGNLTDQLADLSKEMKETQDIYVREKALLQEALDREQGNKELIAARMDSRESSFDSGADMDVTSLKQKLVLANQTIKFLRHENEQWIHRVKKQETLVFHLRESLESGKSASNDFQDVFGQQFAMLKDHRTELLSKLDEKLDGEKLLAQVIGEKTVLEENLRMEKETLTEKMIDKNILESEMLELKLELERTTQEQRFLEEKLYQKDKTEKQLMRQKRMLEEELYEIETKLREREAALELEKSNLLRELKEKDLAIRRYEAHQNSASLLSGLSSPRLSASLTSLSVISSSSSASRAEGGRSRHMEKVREDIEEKHRDAIDILRHQMQVNHSVEELRLREQHTVDLAALNQRHRQQLESVQSQYEGLMKQLQDRLSIMQHPDHSDGGDMEQKGLLQHKHCQQVLLKLKQCLNPGQNEELDDFLTTLEKEHRNTLQILEHNHSEDVVLQLQAMRISVEQVESSRCEVLRAELQKDTLHKLANQREELSHDYEYRIHSLEKSWSERLEKLQTELEGKTVTDKDDAPSVSSKTLIRQLEKRLHEEHNQLLQQLNQEPVKRQEEIDAEDSNITEKGSLDNVELTELLKICSQIVTEYKQLETVSIELKEKTETILPAETDSVKLKPEIPKAAQSEMNSSGWEVEIEDDSQDFSESDHGEFVLETQKSVQSETASHGPTGDANTVKELTKEISDLQSKLKENDLLKEALEESDKQVKELVDIVNSKDEILTRLDGDGDLTKNISEYQGKLTASEERILTLEESLETSEKQNLELSEKLESQLGLYKELENICQTQDSNLFKEREMVHKLNCDMKDRDSQLQSLETKLAESGVKTVRSGDILPGSICDKTVDSESLSTDTSLNESHDEVSRALKEAERRHAEEMEDMTQAYNEEQDKLRDSLKSARAKEVALSEQLEELGHLHDQALTALREQLLHDHKVEVETLKSEFDAQMVVEAKRVATEVSSSKQEQELAKVVKSSVTGNDGDISFESVEKLVANGHSSESDLRKELQLSHEKHLRELTLEWEEKVEKTRLELEEQWEDEKTELERKHEQEMSNVQTQLKDTQEKLGNIIEALDSGEFDSPALEAYRVSLQEKVDLELEMAKKVFQDEYEEQTTSLEEYSAEEQTKFIEQHQKMMDSFIADKEKEKVEIEAHHNEALQALEQRLKAEQAKTEGQSSPRSNFDDDLENELRSKVEQLEDDHRKEILQLTEDYENKLKALKEDLATSHDDQLEAVALDTEVVQSDLDKAHQQELNDLEDRLSEKHRKELGNLEKQLKGKMEDMEDELQEEMERLRKEHKCELKELRNELSSEKDNEDTSPVPQEIIEELSATQEMSLTQYPLGDSDIEIEYESSFIEEEDSDDNDDNRSATPTQMLETLGFEEAGQLAYEATITAPDTSLTAPPSEEIEEEIEEEITEAAEDELAQLDQVLQLTLAQSRIDSPETVKMESSQTQGSPSLQDNELPTRERINELEFEVSRLKTELESKVQETEWIQRQLVQTSGQYQELRVRVVNYEHLEGESLVNMLKSDADRLGQERDTIQRANDHLLHLLSNSLRLYQSTEDNINKNLAKFVSSGSSASNPASSSPGRATLRRSGSTTDQSQSQDRADSGSASDDENKLIGPDAGGDRAGSPDPTYKAESDKDPDSQGTDLCENTSLMSVGTDEGLDLSSRVTEMIFSGPDLDPEGEELLRDGSNRLQSAVLHILDMLGQSGEQLIQAQQVQQDLVETLTAKTEETQQLLIRCQDLDEQFQAERSSKERLASELNITQGSLDGYVAERSQLQKKLEEKDERVQVLVLNLSTANNKLLDLENARGEVEAMRLEVERQQVALQSNLGQESQDPSSGASADTEYIVEPALIQEINKLNQDKRTVSKQRDKDGERSTSRIRDLEMTVEELEKHYDDMLEDKKREIDELQLKVESLDNKLKSNRQFIDEQANDRELEREDHQQEVRRLTQVIQEKDRRECVENRLQREVEDLTDEIQIKTDLMNETGLRNEQLQRDVKDKQSHNRELGDHVKHLERELEEKSQAEKNLQQKISRLEEELKQDSSTSDETDGKRKVPTDDLKHKITTLEQELEAKERTIYHDRESLEEELRKARRLEEELTNEKDALQKQVYDNLHQISQLKTQLDEFKHRYDPDSSNHVTQLKQQLEEEREAVERKEKEVSDLVIQMDQFREQAIDSDENVQQLTNQLRVTERQLETIRSEQNQAVKDLMEENNRLKVKCQQSDFDPTFHQSLLEDKNKEIDDLSHEVERLRDTQSTMGDNTAMKAVLDSLRIELEQKSQDVEELQQTVDNLQHSDALLDTTVSEGDLPPMPSLTERMSIQDEFSSALAMKDDEVLALHKDLELKESELSQARIELETSSKMETSPLNEALLSEKDSNIEQLSIQVDTLQTEVHNLTDFQAKLQEDYDMVQNMLEEKEKEIETLTKELTETRPQAEGATDALMKFELEVEALKKQLKEKDNVIDEKEEELYTLNEKSEEQESSLEKLQNLLKEKEGLVIELQKESSSKSESENKDDRDSSESGKLQQDIVDNEKVISELEQKLTEQASEQEEALGVLRSQLEIAAKALEERDNQVEKLTQALGEEGSESLDSEGRDDTILSLKEKLREAEEERESLEEDKDYLNRELEAFRSEVNKYKQDALNHQTQASEKTAEAEVLREQLALIQREALRIEELTEELNRTRSQLQLISASNSALSLDGATDLELEQVREELQKARVELEVFKQSAALSASEVDQKLETILHQLRQEHAEKLRDQRQEAEREADLKLSELARQHEHELGQLEENHRKEMETAVREACRETEKKLSEEKNLMIQKHNEEVQRLQDRLSIATDDAVVMEVQHQLQSEVATAERLDSRLLEHLSRPRQDGVGHDNPDIHYTEPPLDAHYNPEESVPDRLRVLMTRLHNEGVQMLTLSELQFLKRHSSPVRVEKEVDVSALQSAWENEKQRLLSAIQALKDLLAVHSHRDSEQITELGVSDWRNDLIAAISQVFAKEREALLAELRTHVVSSPSTELSSLQRLENKIRDQGTHHQDSMKQMYSVDRQSLLSEIRDLRSHASITRLQLQDEKQRLSQQLSSAENQLSKRELQLKRQLELLELKLKQEQVLQDDLRSSLSGETTRNQELQSLLNQKHQGTLSLQIELDDSQIQIDKLSDLLQQEENRVKSVSEAKENERSHRNELSNELEEARSECRRLQRLAQEEKRKVSQLEDNEVSLLQTLQVELEKEKDLHSEVTNNLDREKRMADDLRRELQFEKDNLHAVENQFKSRLSQLQSHLESERDRCQELHSAVSREQLLNNQLRHSLEEERGSAKTSTERENAITTDLKALLQTERGRLEEQQATAERDRAQLRSLNTEIDETKRLASEEVHRERRACRELKKLLDSAQEHSLQLSRQHEVDAGRILILEREQTQFRSEVCSLQELNAERDAQRESERHADIRQLRELERERDDHVTKLHESDLELHSLRQKINDLDHQMTSARHSNQQSLRVTSHVSQVTSPRGTDNTDNEEDRLGEFRSRLDRYKTQLEASRQRLHLLLIKHQEDLNRSESSMSYSEMAGRRKAISDLLTEIEQLQRPLALESEARPTISSSPSMTAINDRVMKHNTELTGFVTRLSQEKSELRQNLGRLEEELRDKQRKEAELQLRGRVDLSESMLLAERAGWNQERVTLQMSLDHACQEVDRLKGDLRAEQHRALRLTNSFSSESDNEKIQRLYGKYLRCESFKKALIYQKRYLLLLLGGFQDCEEETLAIIARMGVHPSHEDIQRRSRHSKAFSKFRTAARVIVAIHRMKYLVKKWRRATKVGSPVVTGNGHLQHGYLSTANTYSPPRHTNISHSMRDEEGVSVGRGIHVYTSTTAHYLPYTSLTSQSPNVIPITVATPPTRDKSRLSRSSDIHASPAVRRKLVTELDPHISVRSSSSRESPHNGHMEDDQSLHEDYITRLESLQQRLGGINDAGNLRNKPQWSSVRK